MFPLEQHKLIHTLISKVVVFEDKIQIHFEATGLAGLLKEAGADFEIADSSWSALLPYRVCCTVQAVNWESKWKVKMFQNSL